MSLEALLPTGDTDTVTEEDIIVTGDAAVKGTDPDSYFAACKVADGIQINHTGACKGVADTLATLPHKRTSLVKLGGGGGGGE